MENKEKKIIFWTIYSAIITISILTLITLIIIMIAPTFFPQKDISGFQNYINVFCIILSFASVGLGICSIFQSYSSNQQAIKIIEFLQDIDYQQKSMAFQLTAQTKADKKQKWSVDDIDS